MLLKDAKIGRAYTVKSIHLPFQLERRLDGFGHDHVRPPISG